MAYGMDSSPSESRTDPGERIRVMFPCLAWFRTEAARSASEAGGGEGEKAMQRHRQRPAGRISLRRKYDSSWHWCTRLHHWCASHLRRRQRLSALKRGRHSDGPWGQRRAQTPTSALAYVASQHGPGWALAFHSAMPS